MYVFAVMVNGSAQAGHTKRNTREGRFVLVPDPKVVRELLTRYASLRIAQAQRENVAVARELEDVTYTLCVTMGTTSLHEAVARADAVLVAAERPRVVTVYPVTSADSARATDSDGENDLLAV